MWKGGGGGSLTNALYSNLNTVNLEKIASLEGFILEVNCKEV